MKPVAVLALFLATFLSAGVARSFGQNCPAPPVLQPLSPGLDIFSDEQEADLGDAQAEQIAPRLKIIEDDALTAYLRVLGNRLIQQLPPTRLNFRFFLVDLPEPNAFSIAGGRVYVSRKLVVFSKNEDELAGVIAHELGHIVTHQSGIYMTRRFREVLDVTQVGDRADVFAKYHQYLENYRRKSSKGENEEKEQTAADQVGIFAAFRAGYSPQAYIDALDRLQQSHGQTGSWLTDLFGATGPEQRRLRELIRDMGRLPQGCAEARSAESTQAFEKWKEQLVNYTDRGGEEILPGMVSRTSLSLPLRPDISHLRFSPDGKYLIAQDEGGIHILTRAPLAVLFFIPAPDAHSAEFSPDSQRVIFYTRSLRVETWSIADHSRVSAHELAVSEYCIQSALSFDGKVLACLTARYDLLLLDVATSNTLFTKKQFFVPGFAEAFWLLQQALTSEDWEDFEFIHMKFSPDDHYFVAGHLEDYLVLDLTTRQQVPVGGAIKRHVGSGFAFLGTDRLLVINGTSPSKSQIVSFPGGERLDEVALGNNLHMRAVSRGDYVLLGPLKDHPLGLLDVKTKKIPISFKRAAADVYDDVLVNERLDGEVALYPVGQKQPTEVVRLPEARLGKLRAAAVSGDLEWLAISNHTRGALWNVSRNVRTQYVRSFAAAWFSPDTVLYADFPKFADLPRMIGTTSLPGNRLSDDYKIDDTGVRQQGGFLLVTKPKGKSDHGDCDVEVREIASNKPIWTRHFAHEIPSLTLNSNAHTALLGWSLNQLGGREELQNFPDLKNQANKEDYLYEVVDLQKGTTMGKALVRTNRRSVRLEGGVSDGDWIAVAAGQNQILTFSLPSGEEKGHFFGIAPLLVAAAGVVAVERDAKELDLYDLNTQKLRSRYVFSDPIAMKKVSADGRRLLVLTNTQTLYLFNLAGSQPGSN